MTNDELKAMQDRRERHRQAKIPVQALIHAGRYGEAFAAIFERFSGEDETAVPERFPFDLDTWLCQVVGMVRESAGRAAFIRELMALSETDPVPAVWRVANTYGVQPDVYPELVALLGSDLNREVSLYVTPGLNLSAREGSEIMQGPLWLVLLLCVCRPTRAASIGVLAYKKLFSEADLEWIDQSASLAAKHGADLGLCNTVTWKRSKPVQQDMVANIESRHLRKTADAVLAAEDKPLPSRGRVRL